MELTKLERLMLMQNFRILAALEPEEKEHYERMEQIVTRGYEALYDELFTSIDPDAIPAEESEFVYDVLDMYVAIHDAVEAHSIDLAAQENFALRFIGFDGNNESRLLSFAGFAAREEDSIYAMFLRNGRFPNSHGPTRARYQRMLDEYGQRRTTGEALSADDLEALRQAAVHPENHR
ncbi:YfbU family protein [Deinococcus budaensis]|uniref:YfbU family protein n=1 Tax=Deinococcus budaensis TaxID=1665626 RepID=A0A7W8GF37_9DEIO|nr:YfbU family protein [Deinococcus budaensis]MBB5234459.1 hypothetical protein [Deinococcus budaensis]